MYQNVHTHYLIVGIKIHTHKDIPVPRQNATRTCFFENNFKEVEHENTVKNKTRSKGSADDFLTVAEIHRLQTYWNKYSEQLPSDFDTMYASSNCASCQQKHRDKRFISALLKG